MCYEKIVGCLVKMTIKPTSSLYLPWKNYKMSLYYFHLFGKSKRRKSKVGSKVLQILYYTTTTASKKSTFWFYPFGWFSSFW